MGKILGFSDEHYSLVANVHNFSNVYISPQFNFIFDDFFETVICTRENESVFNAIWNNLFELNRNWYEKYEHDDNVKLIYQPLPLEYLWINAKGRRDRRYEFG